ncbi:hypothetical protein OBBRIDRAFT_792025 [Obba rivulosa]|uniref:Uncharacterized protein n=1 Tax=Obba rivulosa TaxID=1052685 RepID=A0A8E2DM40_9APHY|nr:hypothetical protein OBBRIDRAFT_792025 [Obba rivulosa]
MDVLRHTTAICRAGYRPAPTVGRNNPVQFSNTDAAGPIGMYMNKGSGVHAPRDIAQPMSLPRHARPTSPVGASREPRWPYATALRPILPKMPLPEMAIPERKDDAALTGQSAPSNWRRGKRQRREEVVDGSPPDLRPVKRRNGGDVQPGGVAGPSRAERVPTPSRKRSVQTVAKRPREPKYGACDPCRLLKQGCTGGDKDKACE